MSAFDLYSRYDFLWFFAIYSFLGWCTEVAYAAVCEGRFVNRGFLNGPVCPIYGFGVALVIAALTPLKENGLLLFAGSVALTSALEWITGFVLEKVFHDKWWDYSDLPFNLNGYICLKFSLIWGLACTFIMDVFHPTVVKAVGWIPNLAGWIIIGILLTLFAVDAIVTAASILKLNKRMEQMDEIAIRLRSASDRLGETISDNVTELMEKSEEWKEMGGDVKEGLLEMGEGLLEKTGELQDELAEKKEALQEELAERRDAFQDELAERRDAFQDELAERRDAFQDELAERRLRIQAALERKQLDLKAQIEELREAYEALAGSKKFIHKRVMKAFPGMKSKRHSEALEEIKKRYGLK